MRRQITSSYKVAVADSLLLVFRRNQVCQMMPELSTGGEIFQLQLQ